MTAFNRKTEYASEFCVVADRFMRIKRQPRFLLAMRKKLSGASDGALALPKMNSRLLPP